MTQIDLQDIALLSGHYQETSASITFVYRGAEFTVHFEFSEQTTPTLAEYQAAVEPIHNPRPGVREAHQDLLRLLLQPLHAIIDSRVNNPISGCIVSLQRLLLSPHYRLHVHMDKSVSAYEDIAGPTFYIKPLCLKDLESKEISSLARIQPSDIVFVGFDPSRPSLQGQVRLYGNKRAFFKPVEIGRDTEITREIRIQSILQGQGTSSKHYVSTTLGLAMAGDDSHICGLLFHWIQAKPLGEIDNIRRARHQLRWRNQIACFLRFMHSTGTAWGDINEFNILVDDEDEGGNAWAIDFGGKTGTEYGLLDVEQLKREDWIEFERIFREV